MKFQYTLKDGTVIDDINEIEKFFRYVEAACTGKTIQEEYLPDLPDNKALEFGYEVRNRMADTRRGDWEAEEDFIREVLEEEGLLEEED